MDTSEPPQTPLAANVERPDRIFPTLTPEQLSRIVPRGRRRATTRGEVLVQVGDRNVPCFVVVSGEIEAVRPTPTGETLIVRHGPGQFSG